MTDIDVCWYEDDEWRGFLPVEPRSELLSRHVFDTWIAGIWHYPQAADDPSFAPGESIALVVEPDNPHDPLAIGVWNADRTLQVGHVPAVVVAGLAADDRTAVCLSEQTEAGKRMHLRILVSREPVSLRLVPDSAERDTWKRATVARLKKQATKTLPSEPTPDIDPIEQMTKMHEGRPDAPGRPTRALRGWPVTSRIREPAPHGELMV